MSQERDGFDDADRLRVVEPTAAAIAADEEGGDGRVVEHGVLEVLPDGGAARAAVVGVVAVAVVLQVGAILVGRCYLWDMSWSTNYSQKLPNTLLNT